MPLKYLIDEQLRGQFIDALVQRGVAEGCPVDAVESGGAAGPALGTLDPPLLDWAQANDRILVSLDRNSLPKHLWHHLAAGKTSPGIFLIRTAFSWDEIFQYLVFASVLKTPDECANRWTFIPEHS